MVSEMLNLMVYLEIMVNRNKTQKTWLFIQNCSFSLVVIVSHCKSRWNFSAEYFLCAVSALMFLPGSPVSNSAALSGETKTF